VSGFGVRAASEDGARHSITAAIVSRSKIETLNRDHDVPPRLCFQKSAVRVFTANAIPLASRLISDSDAHERQRSVRAQSSSRQSRHR
jgi:fructose-specific phosphotransferase system component IIB